MKTVENAIASAQVSFARIGAVVQAWRVYYPGIAVCVITAVAASALAARYQAPVMLFALLLGLSLNFLYRDERYSAGIEFVARHILRIGVALLGVRIATEDILSLGITIPLYIMGAMVVTIALGIVLARLLGLTREFGLLSGGAVSVCGVSAAAAIASVLPKRKQQDSEFLLTVVAVTILSTLAMVVYPLVADWLGLSDRMAGVFIGGSIHDVAQVVGAGYSISPEAGDVATYVKLLRVALLLPVVVSIFLLIGRGHREMESSLLTYVPVFLVAFFLLAGLKNAGFIPDSLSELLQTVSRWCLVVSLAAIGIKTALGDVYAVGWRPVMLVVLETLFFSGLILTGIYLIP